MKNKIKYVLKNILGMVLFWTVACGIGYATYYLMLRDILELKFIELLGMYFIVLQMVIVVMITMKNDK
jgi:hypothetical protein